MELRHTHEIKRRLLSVYQELQFFRKTWYMYTHQFIWIDTLTILCVVFRCFD